MGAACMTAKGMVEEELKKQQGGQKGDSNAEVPKVGEVIVLYNYDVIGKVTSFEPGYRGGKVMLEVYGGPKDTRREPEEYSVGEFKKLDDIPALKPFLPSLECTATFRGSKVNGWIEAVGQEDSQLKVHFLPDAAHDSVDKTHWVLGARDSFQAADLTPGHNGDERPRNRTVKEIAEEKQAVLSYGISYVHCCRCGRGIWEDPCNCYVVRAPGYACAQCGKKHKSANAVCCGERISENAQNQGWASTLEDQYGQF